MWSKFSASATRSRAKQAEDDERGYPLGRRRRIVKRAGIDGEAERLGHHGAGGFEVGAGHRAAEPSTS